MLNESHFFSLVRPITLWGSVLTVKKQFKITSTLTLCSCRIANQQHKQPQQKTTKGETQIPQPDSASPSSRETKQNSKWGRTQQKQRRRICHRHSGEKPLCRPCGEQLRGSGKDATNQVRYWAWTPCKVEGENNPVTCKVSKTLQLPDCGRNCKAI